MDLRHKLLVSFVAVIVLASFVFGFNAYEIAKNAALERERSLVREATHTQAAMLAAEYRRAPSRSTLTEHLGISDDTVDRTILLLDAGGKVEASLAVRNGRTVKTGADQALTFLHQHTRNKDFSSGGKLYIWDSAPIAGTHYVLVRIERSDSDARGMLRRLASRLVVAGLILNWLAIWVALIISTAVSRRLMAQTKELQHHATHDNLTGLPNRTLLLQHLNAAINSAATSKMSVALIMMDLDRFKEINNTLGHNFGDSLLQALADRLKQALWGSDTVARLGGDEYALLLPMADTAHSAQVTEKVLTAIAKPFVLNGITLEVDASLGIAVYPEDGKDAVDLIRHADVAMYQAKHAGTAVSRYDPSRDPHSMARLKLIGELRHAIDRGELSLNFQPKVEIASHAVVGVEALLRWHHPEQGFISPDTFIPIAEQTGIIKTLTYWVLESAIRQAALWNAANIPLTISVNLSARVLHDAHLISTIRAALERHHVNPRQLELEITETAIMLDPARALEMLKSLSAMGVHLSIDDFGTGYTSMAYLKRLPVDEVKIDKSFVMNMMKDANDGVIVRSIIDLAHNMNFTVVAEGVETKKILDALTEMTCDFAQGYYLGKPLSLAELETRVKSALLKPARWFDSEGREDGLLSMYNHRS